MLPPPLQSCTYKAPTAAPRLHHRCPSAAAAGADCGAEARPDLTSHCARSEVKFSPFVAAAPGLISHPDEPGRPPSPSMSPRPPSTCHLRVAPPTTNRCHELDSLDSPALVLESLHQSSICTTLVLDSLDWSVLVLESLHQTSGSLTRTPWP
jgi:hypothetical protein